MSSLYHSWWFWGFYTFYLLDFFFFLTFWFLNNFVLLLYVVSVMTCEMTVVEIFFVLKKNVNSMYVLLKPDSGIKGFLKTLHPRRSTKWFHLFLCRILSQLWGDVYGNGQHPCHPQQLPGSENSLQSDPWSRKVSRSVWHFFLSSSAFICLSPFKWLHLTVRQHHTTAVV